MFPREFKNWKYKMQLGTTLIIIIIIIIIPLGFRALYSWAVPI